MPDWIVPALLALVVMLLLVIVWRAFSRPDTSPFEQAVERQVGASVLSTVGSVAQQLERELRDEMARQAQASRGDLGTFQQALLAQGGEAVRTQNEQIDSFRTQLAVMQQQVGEVLSRHAETTAMSQQRLGQTLAEQLKSLADANDRRLAEVRQTVEARLATLQEGNEKKLEQMRATVDEKLHATLEQRLGESFRQVAERLEQVHKGLGEMQVLARDVGSLNRVLSNVKTRGIVGEVQLAGLLEQVFSPEQYAANVETVPGSNARVEFAIRLPGHEGRPLWLPIDAKFPREDYERLLDAQERADPDAAEAAARAIETRFKLEAKAIREKYVAAPHTTDFAILFVPTEGLYAEALRRAGLVDALQREHRVTLAGPTTLLATLTSLQMGFRTLALEKRSSEVWEVLGAVKTEFAKFGEVLARVKNQTQTVLNTIGHAETRTRQMTRALKAVEAMPETQARALLPSPNGDDAAADPASDANDTAADDAIAPAGRGPAR